MARINPGMKKWITLIVVFVLAAMQIPSLADKLPGFLSNVVFSGITWIQLIAYLGILCIYWIATKAID